MPTYEELSATIGGSSCLDLIGGALLCFWDLAAMRATDFRDYLTLQQIPARHICLSQAQVEEQAALQSGQTGWYYQQSEESLSDSRRGREEGGEAECI